ncbi:MAG: hypothetical protein AAGF85_05340 [Bacteroidota bacterium]
MKKILEYKYISILILTVMIVTSCGDDDTGDGDGAVTQGQMIIEAILGTWDVDISGIPVELQSLISDPSVTISSSSPSVVSWSTDASSGLADFILGGSFVVEDDGSVSSADIIPTPGTNYTISGIDVSLSEVQVMIDFTLSAEDEGGRTKGLSDWTLIINTVQ